MSKSDTMAKLPGLFQREGVWTLRVMIPKDLQPAYNGRTKLVESLGTSNHDTAKVVGTARRAILLGQFDQKRRELNPQRIETVTPELAKLLAQRVSAAILGTDDTIRGRPEAAALLLDTLRPLKAAQLSGLTIGGAPTRTDSTPRAPIDPLQGLTPELAAELAELNQGANIVAAQQMAMQRIAAVLPLVRAEARALGLEFNERTPGALDALRECLRAYRRAWQDVAKRDTGEAVESPQAPSRTDALQVKPTKLRDVFPHWKASKTRKRQTEQAAELALSLYEKATGNPAIGSLTRTQGVEFRAWLLAQETSSKTARDRFDYVKGLLNFAAREMELLARNPWTGLAIEYKTKKPRRPWSIEQLRVMLARSLFTAYELPSAWNAGADAAYWIPLLAAFSGARLGELVQLRTADVETIDGVPVLYINDEDEDASVKTEAGRRLVPVHSELIRLGFLEYAAAMREARKERLFPSLKLAPSKPSNYFSDWFSNFKKAGDGPPLPDFHSLRHTVRTRLASARVSEPMMNVLIGHEVGGSEGAKTYTHRTTEDLKHAMEMLSYPGLTLQRVYRPAR